MTSYKELKSEILKLKSKINILEEELKKQKTESSEKFNSILERQDADKDNKK